MATQVGIEVSNLNFSFRNVKKAFTMKDTFDWYYYQAEMRREATTLLERGKAFLNSRGRWGIVHRKYSYQHKDTTCRDPVCKRMNVPTFDSLR